MNAATGLRQDQIDDFSAHLRNSKYILALLGAGLSASSGLPTFRGAGGLWRTHDAMTLATPEAFNADPGLVWQFYSYRRHMALRAQPNRAHLALAELARQKKMFLTLSQNVDGLSQRAGHPQSLLELLHGSLFDVKCTGFYCDYQGQNYDDPIVESLRIPAGDPTSKEAREHMAQEMDISNAEVDLPSVAVGDLPKCPKCKTGLLRPGVVWFGEMLPTRVVSTIHDYIANAPAIDLMMVIGTSLSVYPAAGYVEIARQKGARVAVVDVDADEDEPASFTGPQGGDWLFRGDAAVVVPEILKGVIGDIQEPSELD